MLISNYFCSGTSRDVWFHFASDGGDDGILQHVAFVPQLPDTSGIQIVQTRTSTYATVAHVYFYTLTMFYFRPFLSQSCN